MLLQPGIENEQNQFVDDIIIFYKEKTTLIEFFSL